MPLKKTEAIVLKSQRQGETSKILTLYTRAFGKLTVIAKGARSMKSKFGGSLEPFNYISIVFYEKETREIQLLSQADIIEFFAGIKLSVEKTALAMAVCELVNNLESGIEPNPILFKLHLEALKAINQNDNSMNVWRAFQVKLLNILGIRPDFTTCSKCKNQKQGAVAFDITQGSFICEACGHVHAAGMILSADSFQVLRSFQRDSLASLNGLLTSEISCQQVDGFIAAYLKYHVEGLRDLKAVKFLRKLQLSGFNCDIRK